MTSAAAAARAVAVAEKNKLPPNGKEQKQSAAIAAPQEQTLNALPSSFKLVQIPGEDDPSAYFLFRFFANFFKKKCF